jgi:putative DNA methylase
MSIESRFDIPLIASMALKEKQIQQNYRPIIAVHKWFARRPGNPIAAWIVREELEHLDLDAYRAAAASLMSTLEKKIGDFYRTDCPHYGDHNVPVKYFLWVKTLPCENCGEAVDLLPGYLVADNTRHPRNVVACANCGELNEVEKLDNPARCGNCKKRLVLEGPARRGRCACQACGHVNAFPRANHGPMAHQLWAIEYYDPARKEHHKGRFFKKPDAKDLARWEKARKQWAHTRYSGHIDGSHIIRLDRCLGRTGRY